MVVRQGVLADDQSCYPLPFPFSAQAHTVTRHVFLTVLVGSVLLLALALLIPSPEPEVEPERLPWQVRALPDGSARVFGVTLERTTLGEAEVVFGEEAEVSLFVSSENEYAVEGYFDTLILDGLKARMVLNVALSEAVLEGMYDRGLRISTLGSGSRRVTLHPDDLAHVRRTPVSAITYMPNLDLDPTLVEKRFGTPGRRLADPEEGSAIVHWLYPQKGLDIALSGQGQDVLQYVPLRDFERLVRPLEGR